MITFALSLRRYHQPKVYLFIAAPKSVCVSRQSAMRRWVCLLHTPLKIGHIISPPMNEVFCPFGLLPPSKTQLLSRGPGGDAIVPYNKGLAS
jgi:hypothetical protein